MKNLLFCCACFLITSLGFANTSSSSELLKSETTQIESPFNIIDMVQIDLTGVTCVSVETTCGIYGTVCSNTTQGLGEAALDLDDWVC